MASTNPMLSEQYFRTTARTAPSTIDAQARQAAFGTTGVGYPPITTEKTMTMGGVVSATGALLVCILVGAGFGWNRVTITTVRNELEQSFSTVHFPVGLLIGSVLVAFVFAMIARFKPPMAQFLGIPYALVEGFALGMISHAYDIQSKGIAVQAVLATFGVFAVMLVLYSMRILRATPKFVKGVIAATGGIMLMYVFALIFSAFGTRLDFLNSTSPLSIGISVVIVAVAAFNLIIDFDFIERGSAAGLPKHMEWFAALGLVITIVWLYLEMLRLLSKLQRR